MRGTVVKALRRESVAQNRPLRELKRMWRGMNHLQRRALGRGPPVFPKTAG